MSRLNVFEIELLGGPRDGAIVGVAPGVSVIRAPVAHQRPSPFKPSGPDESTCTIRVARYRTVWHRILNRWVGVYAGMEG
jgi:hypothetical protein